MIVKCENLDHFGKLIIQFTMAGLTFEARSTTLTIELTGGY